MTTQTIEITDLTDDQVQVMFRHLCSVSRGQWVPFTPLDVKQAYAIAVVGTTPPPATQEPEPMTTETTPTHANGFAGLSPYEAIRAERAYQDQKWGGPEHDRQHTLLEWSRILRDEFNEAIAAMRGWTLTNAPASVRSELIQVAAVAVAIVEQIDAHAAKPMPDHCGDAPTSNREYVGMIHDIEPGPVKSEGRRNLEPLWEEIEVLKLSVNSMHNRVKNGFGTHWSAIRGLLKREGKTKRKLTALQEQVQALEERSDAADDLEQPSRLARIQSFNIEMAPPEMSDAKKWHNGLDEATLQWAAQPEPAADAEDTYDWGLNMLGGIAFSRNGVVVHIATREQLAKVGLVRPIDPNDERLVQVVAGLLPEDDDDINERYASNILAALADAQTPE